MDEETLKLQYAAKTKKTGIADQSRHKSCEVFKGEDSNIAERVLPLPPQPRIDQVHDLQMLPSGIFASERKNSEIGGVLVRKLDARSQDEAKRKANTVEPAKKATATAECPSLRDEVASEPKRKKTQTSQQDTSDLMPYLENSDENDHLYGLQMLPGWKIGSDRKDRETKDIPFRQSDSGSHEEAKRKASTVKPAEEATSLAERSNSFDQVASEPKRRKTQKSEQASFEEVVPYFERSDLFDMVRKEATAAEGSSETNPDSWNTGQKASEKAEKIAVNAVSDLAHGSVQAKERRHKCHMCDRAFTCSSNLKKHISVHTGEKPYLCQVCGKECSQSGNLDVHMRVHTGEKPYLCQVCGKECSQSGNLEVHMRVHTGEKPYKCDLCKKGV